MGYGREMLRKAGSMMLDADAAYARALVPKGTDAPFAKATRGSSLREFRDVDMMDEGGLLAKALTMGTVGGLGVANVAARYGLPAGGITLAGKGLMDLTGMFVGENEQTSGTLMP